MGAVDTYRAEAFSAACVAICTEGQQSFSDFCANAASYVLDTEDPVEFDRRNIATFGGLGTVVGQQMITEWGKRLREVARQNART